MREAGSRFMWLLTLVCMLNFAAVAGAVAADRQATAPGASLLSIGAVRPGAIGLKVWTEPSSDTPLHVGDRVAIHFEVDRDCHVLAANVSPDGDVAIIFPNWEQPDNSAKANREYTLFGTDSKLKLVFGKGISEAWLVFYVSPDPIDLKPFKITESRGVVLIPSNAQEKIGLLRKKIEQLSETAGFNRYVLSLQGDATKQKSFQLMGPPGKPVSTTPGSVTGTRGRAESPLELGK
jgi:hypothetical protein